MTIEGYSEKKTRFRSVILFCMVLMFLASVLFFVFVGFQARLISDDYCSALNASSQGIFGYTTSQLLDWSGAASAALTNALLGTWMSASFNTFPYLLWTVGSSILGSLVVFSVVRTLVTYREFKERILLWLFSYSVFALFVLGQFGLPSSMGVIDFAFGYMWVGWMAAGLSQIIPAFLTILVVITLVEYVSSNQKKYIYVATLLAFNLGLFNFLSALTVAIFVFVYGIGRGYVKRIFPVPELIVGTLSVLGALLNYLSPGTQSRAELVSESAPIFSLSNVPGTISNIIYHSASDSILLAIIVGLFIGLVIRITNTTKIRETLGVLLLLYVSSVTATFIIENVAFSEPWHFASVAWISFLLALVTAITAGSAIKAQFENSNLFVGVMSGFLGISLLALMVVQATLVSGQVKVRSENWTSGAESPVFFIADRETDWVKSCWNALND